jgi:phosphate butyryltransferase
MIYRRIEEILETAKGRKAGRIAIAAAHDEDVLKAAAAAADAGIAAPVLVGDADKISGILRDLGRDPAEFSIVAAAGPEACAAAAVHLVREGGADFLMKGLLGTADLLKAVLDKDSTLRTGRLLSHVMLYENPTYPKILALTDGGITPFPDLAKKADILENAAILLHGLGYESMIAACVCGAEIVDPKIQATLDAAALRDMKERWAPYAMQVLGPVGLDLAISVDACRHKNYREEGGGNADILLAPTYEVGNGIGKAMSYFAGAKSAGIVVGARVPIVLVSRSDDAHTKLASIALGALAARKGATA